jgi:hypothetical protein
MHRRHHPNRSAHVSRTPPTRAHASTRQQSLMNTSPPPKGASLPHGPNRASGRGWQTAVALALLTCVKLAFQIFPFADAGDDSEDTAVLRSNRDHAAAQGIELPQVRIRRGDVAEHLGGQVLDHQNRRSFDVLLPLEDGKRGAISDSGWCSK